MKKKFFGFILTLLLVSSAMPMYLVLAETGEAESMTQQIAETTKSGSSKSTVVCGAEKIGQMGDVASYVSYENGSIVVKAEDSFQESMQAIAVSYEDGKMVAFEPIHTRFPSLTG